MSYAAPFAYATKGIYPDPYAPVSAGHHSRSTRQRRRRIAVLLLPALRPRRRGAPAPAALATDSAGSR